MREWLIGTLLLSWAQLACGGAETDIDQPDDSRPIGRPQIQDPPPEEIAVATIEPWAQLDPEVSVPRPIAHAETLREVTLGDLIHLDGSASTSGAGGTLSYIWSVEQRPVGSFFELGEDAPIIIEGDGLAAFLPDRMGTWGVGLVVDDGQTRSAQVFAHIRVMGPGERPVVHTETSSTPRVGERVVIDASGSTNPLEQVEPLHFYWSPDSLPEASRCLDTVEGLEEAVFSFVPDVEGRYVFVVWAVAAGVESDPTYLIIHVAP